MTAISELEQKRNEWLAQIKMGNTEAIEMIYRTYRDDFVEWLKSNTNCDEQRALDVFQESVLALYKNIKAEKLKHFTSSIKWYLFSIGKKIHITQMRKKKVKINFMADVPDIGESVLTPSLRDDTKDRQEAYILKALKHMSDPCYTILYLFYYEKEKITAIAQKLGYKNANIASIQKGRCIKSLRRLVEKKFGQ